MTGRIYEFLGHKMRIEAEGKVLTRCAWLASVGPPSDYLPSDCLPSDELPPEVIPSSAGCREASEEEGRVIEMAVRQISEYLAGRRREFTIPLHLKATDFRLKVWNELRKIPFGTTVSYKELAGRIGSPKGCRAVANACGANPFPILIPCHRVVATDGRPGGYTGGLDIKLALLDLEKAKEDKGNLIFNLFEGRGLNLIFCFFRGLDGINRSDATIRFFREAVLGPLV